MGEIRRTRPDHERFGFVCRHDDQLSCGICGLHQTTKAYKARCPHAVRDVERLDMGPHVAKLVCRECGNFLRWVSKLDFALANIAAEEGRKGS